MKRVGMSLVTVLLLLGTLLFGGCGANTDGSVVLGEVELNPEMEGTDREAAPVAEEPQVISGALWDWWRNRYGDGGGNTTPPPTTTECASTLDSYGKTGPYTMTYESFSNPMWAGGKQVTVFYPKERTDPAPVMFFSHGFGGNTWTGYKSIISNMATRGFVVVFSPYPTQLTPVKTNYDIMFNGFVLASQKYASRMDLTKVGFLGHSYGGGAVPSMARRGLEKGWGTKGALMFPMAPWYVYDMTDAQMASFPAHIKLIAQLYNEDNVNDHRMGMDIFNSTTSIPSSEKAYYNGVSGAVEPVGHTVPSNREVNQLDFDLVQKSLDALMDYAFNIGSCGTAAKGFALDGTGTRFQHTVTKNPVPAAAESFYQQRWSSSMNPRR